MADSWGWVLKLAISLMAIKRSPIQSMGFSKTIYVLYMKMCLLSIENFSREGLGELYDLLTVELISI